VQGRRAKVPDHVTEPTARKKYENKRNVFEYLLLNRCLVRNSPTELFVSSLFKDVLTTTCVEW
jgi:hypothetical protein